MPAFIDALCYLFPWRSWIIRPLIIAGRPPYPTKQPGCLPTWPRTNFDFVQITDLSESWRYEPRFAHFSAFRRKPCISLRLRWPPDENWSVPFVPVHDHSAGSVYSGEPCSTCAKSKPALRASHCWLAWWTQPCLAAQSPLYSSQEPPRTSFRATAPPPPPPSHCQFSLK